MYSSEFWRELIERAIKTMAEALLAWIMVGQPIWEMDWKQGFGLAATATVVSILASIASTQVGDPESASMVSGGRHRAGK